MFANKFIIWLLTSPGHFLLSGNTAVLHVRGAKSGTIYHIPVNYLQSGDTLTVVSSRDRTWWRNLRGGAPLSLQLRGANVAAHGNVLENEEAVLNALRDLLLLQPGYARALGVQVNDASKPFPASLAQAARERVVIRLQLGTEAYQSPAVKVMP